MNTTTFEFSYDKSDLTQFFVSQWGVKYRVKTKDGGNSRYPAEPLIFVDSWSIDSKGWCPYSLMTEHECKNLFVGYWVEPKPEDVFKYLPAWANYYWQCEGLLCWEYSMFKPNFRNHKWHGANCNYDTKYIHEDFCPRNYTGSIENSLMERAEKVVRS